jgi:hypothetical protein
MLDDLQQKIKNLSFLHSDKILLFFLIAVLIASASRSTSSLLRELNSQGSAVSTAFTKKEVLPQTGITPEENAELVKMIQRSLEFRSEQRDIFSRKNEEQADIVQIEQKEKTDTDQDGLPNEWEVRYSLDPSDSSDAQKDLDKDSYSNLDEYIGGSDPADSNSFPGQIKMRVLNIFRKGIQVNFFGYIKLPDASFQLQINWGSKTVFLKVGQKIRGYKITEFAQSIDKKFNSRINAEENVDVSYIKIQKESETPITLFIGKPSFEKELYATIQDMVAGKVFSVHAGSRIKPYKVLDITPTKVIISRNKKIYTLQRSTVSK